MVVSTDGVSFPQLTTLSDVSGMPDVFEVFGSIEGGENTLNPEESLLDISAAISGNPSTVWIRFYWTGLYEYAWFVDDVQVEEIPPYDLSMASTLLSHSPTGIEFGSLPPAQIGPSMHVGARIVNMGQQPQTGVVLHVNFQGPTPHTVDVPTSDVQPGDTGIVSQWVNVPMFMPGSYAIDYSVTSNESGSDADPTNNTLLRHLDVNNGRIALDALDAIPPGEANVDSIGTSTFTDMEDGMILFTYMEVHTEVEVTHYEALITPGTEPGGEVYFSLHDTVAVFDDTFAPIHEAAVVTITAQDVAAGRIRADFPPGYTLPPGGYYVAAELYSYAGSYPISLFDDESLPAMPMEASLMYAPGDVLYANGTAVAIRLLTGDPADCHAEYIVAQATDGNGDPIPFSVEIQNVSSSDALDFDSFWDFGDGATSTEDYPQHDYATNGPFEVCLTISDNLGCADQYCDSIMVDTAGWFSREEGFSIQVVEDFSTGVEAQAGPSSIRLWPDPVVDVLYFEHHGATEVSVCDMEGRVVLRERLGAMTGTASIRTAALRPGAYLLHLLNEGEPRSMERFVKAP